MPTPKHQISIRLSEEGHERLDVFMSTTGLRKSSAVRLLLEMGLDTADKLDPQIRDLAIREGVRQGAADARERLTRAIHDVLAQLEGTRDGA